MNLHKFSDNSVPAGNSAADTQREPDDDGYQYSVVSDWFDAGRMDVADLSGEVAGRRVVVFADGTLHEAPNSSQDSHHTASGIPGVLFCGDDGDSYWFWPESEDLAFRFEPVTAEKLRRELPESVNRLVSQGALVFCYKLDAVEQGGLVVEFPVPEENAA